MKTPPTEAQKGAGFTRNYRPESTPKQTTALDVEAMKLRRRIEDVRQGLELDREFAEVWE